MNLAAERAAFILEAAQLDQEAREAAGTRVADTEEDLRKEAWRDACRNEERDHWMTVMMPLIRKGATPYELRKGYY